MQYSLIKCKFTSEQFKSWAQKIQGTKEDVEGEQEQQDPYNGPHNADDFTAAVQLCGLYKKNHFKGYYLIRWFEFFLLPKLNWKCTSMYYVECLYRQ